MFDAGKCIMDLACYEACRHTALYFLDRNGEPVAPERIREYQDTPELLGERVYDTQACTLCGACVDVCYAQALEMVGRMMSVEQALAEFGRDRAFYRNSGGGITLSGGEPLYQDRFSLHLLAACQAAGLHTALDTTAYARWEPLEAVVAHTDLVLLDIKHMDSAKHREYTGVRNERILDNARRLAGLLNARSPGGTAGASSSGDVISGSHMPGPTAAAAAGPAGSGTGGEPGARTCDPAKPVQTPADKLQRSGMWIRMPVIPGMNDDPANMEATATFVRDELGEAVRVVELLGYHQLGGSKHRRLGTRPDTEGISPPGRGRLQDLVGSLQAVLQGTGIRVTGR